MTFLQLIYGWSVEFFGCHVSNLKPQESDYKSRSATCFKNRMFNVTKLLISISVTIYFAPCIESDCSIHCFFFTSCMTFNSIGSLINE